MTRKSDGVSYKPFSAAEFLVDTLGAASVATSRTGDGVAEEVMPHVARARIGDRNYLISIHEATTEDLLWLSAQQERYELASQVRGLKHVIEGLK